MSFSQDIDVEAVVLETGVGYCICHIEYLSEGLKDIIRDNFVKICCGEKGVKNSQRITYDYKQVVSKFLEIYETKSEKTQLGMIGELVSHILLPELLDDFIVSSLLFNLEEKSIKKGFDIVLISKVTSQAWLTEIKSGTKPDNRTHNQVTKSLLGAGRRELIDKLNSGEIKYWDNAINHARMAWFENNDLRDALTELLYDEQDRATSGTGSGSDNSVIVVSALFEDIQTKVTADPATAFLGEALTTDNFEDVIVFCIQKSTQQAVLEFLNGELRN